MQRITWFLTLLPTLLNCCLLTIRREWNRLKTKFISHHVDKEGKSVLNPYFLIPKIVLQFRKYFAMTQDRPFQFSRRCNPERFDTFFYFSPYCSSVGLEPTTPALQAQGSTNWATRELSERGGGGGFPIEIKLFIPQLCQLIPPNSMTMGKRVLRLYQLQHWIYYRRVNAQRRACVSHVVQHRHTSTTYTRGQVYPWTVNFCPYKSPDPCLLTSSRHISNMRKGLES